MVSKAEEVGLVGILSALDQLDCLTDRVASDSGPVISDQQNFNTAWEEPDQALEYLSRWRRELLRVLVAVGREGVFDRSWLDRPGGAVRGLAERMRDQRDIRNLPILADALEEVGCENPALLARCRQPVPDAEFCWVVDLLLGEWDPSPIRPADPAGSPRQS